VNWISLDEWTKPRNRGVEVFHEIKNFRILKILKFLKFKVNYKVNDNDQENGETSRVHIKQITHLHMCE
jgi:hypothetical protein